MVAFWLQDYPNTQFFAAMFVIFFGVLMALRNYHKDPEYAKLLDYDENLSFTSFFWIALGIVVTFFLSSFIISQYGQSSIWIPKSSLAMTYLSFQLSGFWNDLLFQLVLVAPAEELCKLTLHLALYLKLKGAIGDFWSRFLSITVPIFFWSMLHVYRAYTGGMTLFLLAAAFAGGVVIFAMMYKTKSVLAAILVHAGYNIVVLVLNS